MFLPFTLFHHRHINIGPALSVTHINTLVFSLSACFLYVFFSRSFAHPLFTSLYMMGADLKEHIKIVVVHFCGANTTVRQYCFQFDGVSHRRLLMSNWNITMDGSNFNRKLPTFRSVHALLNFSVITENINFDRIVYSKVFGACNPFRGFIWFLVNAPIHQTIFIWNPPIYPIS